ncbi:MAG: polyphosphate kinase 2 family protein [Dehalococcoidia bacterium]|nr:polyphosphate kinase 2 family protein [Dehalococcoidia bacterium]
MSDHLHVAEPGKQFRLEHHAPEATPGLSEDEGEALLPELRLRLDELQELLYADRRSAVLVVLQGMDAAGKDGTIRSVFREVGPLGCMVANFGVPTPEEAAHDFLWRYHLQAPARGRIAIFNRSYYESVLVERVHGLVPKSVWKGRYGAINRFEALLAAEGTVVVKFFLHVSKEEQRQRLQERVDNPKKRWKFREGDLDERKLWDDYGAAYEDMVNECSTETAPWHVVPADHKWYRDVVVARALIRRLEALDLRYPEAAPGIVGTIVI